MVLSLFIFGLINWFSTLLIVESEFFRPLRAWIRLHKFVANYKYDVASRKVSVRWRALVRLFWTKIDFMITCQMCMGVWVGLALVPFMPPAILALFVAPAWIQFILAALIVKAIGHAFLVLHKLGERKAQELESLLPEKPDN